MDRTQDAHSGTSPGPVGMAESRAVVNLRSGRRRVPAALALLGGCLLSLAPAGCSLFVMTGKALMGEPMIKAPFSETTRVSLTKSRRPTAVLVSTTETIRSQYPGLEQDLLSAVTLKLKRSGVNVVDAHKVATWVDDHGGDTSDLTAFARDIKTDFVIQISVLQWSHMETGSPNLYRGRAEIDVKAYEVQRRGEKVTGAFLVYSATSKPLYPRLTARPVDQLEDSVFQERFLSQAAELIAIQFYDSRPGTDF